jgi:hypothetical protein
VQAQLAALRAAAAVAAAAEADTAAAKQEADRKVNCPTASHVGVANRPSRGLARGDRKMPLERGTNPRISRRTCSPRYALRYRRPDWAGVAKQRRELISHPNPY